MNRRYPCLSFFAMLLLAGCAGQNMNQLDRGFRLNADKYQNIPGNYNRGHGYYGEYRRSDVY
ncbi:hypothetical protein F6R98_17230 [Candidatus Methylospira mobilis]|uniref:Lipoprotein n=1 Tax=Candidatus Methylospira mobilis TaxID=1808979 RepID=A0A5Q0BLZ9_9GAMM|nr:hypothetical protein [Candidatus Methylospira mobilis]QFY44162.1 hypothetical protein F6R98_17230 [Candidatus Methylospira mobilis]WNV06418.1 hypothetical protein RP726_08440 [Candidatus Methylospira mobilis]